MDSPLVAKHLYCLGIGGVGVSAIARFARHHGSKVSGLDVRRSPLIEDLEHQGVTIYLTPDPAHLTSDIDAVVYSDDVQPDHPERRAAEERGIPRWSFAEALGKILAAYEQRVAIAGTNGKSTTTAITGLITTAGQLDPMIFVGSRLKELQGNIRLGKSSLGIVEADEYRDHFLVYNPTHVTITNIELDHVDYFGTLYRLMESFDRFVRPEMHVVANAGDRNARDLWADRPQTTWFGFGPDADVRVVDWRTSSGKQEFTIEHAGERIGPFQLHLPGKMNIENALAAMTMSHVLGLPFAAMKSPLLDFRGIWRRFEILQPSGSISVVNDYAHHPTGVRATIAAAKTFFPGRRVIAVFQPHHRHRLHALFDGFAQSFTGADITILTDIYVVSGRDEAAAATPTSRDLLVAIERHDQQIIYAPTLDDMVDAVKTVAKSGDVILLMGAGDIWERGQQLATDLHDHR